jgi:hypothetical protein
MKTRIFQKILIWWCFIGIFGYLAGAVLLTIVIQPSFGGLSLSKLYYHGVYAAAKTSVVMLLPFLALTSLWFWFCHKKYNLDKSRLWVFLFTIFIGFYTAVVFPLMLGAGISEIDAESFVIFFTGGFVGSLLPRIFIKMLRPGNIV